MVVVALAAAALALPHGQGWASTPELHWLQTLGARVCALPAPPTQRLLPAFRLAHRACADHDAKLASAARRRALVGYDQPLPPGRLVYTNHVSYTNTDYSRIASRIAGKRVAAHCWSLPDWNALDDEVVALTGKRTEFYAAGFADIGASSIELLGDVCQTLGFIQLRYRTSDFEKYAAAFGEAVDVLAHEATHAKGVDDEAVTECYAIQRVAATALQLHVSPATARLFAAAVWRRYPSEPKGYATPRCHDGGPLDLHPRTRVWS